MGGCGSPECFKPIDQVEYADGAQVWCARYETAAAHVMYSDISIGGTPAQEDTVGYNLWNGPCPPKCLYMGKKAPDGIHWADPQGMLLEREEESANTVCNTNS